MTSPMNDETFKESKAAEESLRQWRERRIVLADGRVTVSPGYSSRTVKLTERDHHGEEHHAAITSTWLAVVVRALNTDDTAYRHDLYQQLGNMLEDNYQITHESES